MKFTPEQRKKLQEHFGWSRSLVSVYEKRGTPKTAQVAEQMSILLRISLRKALNLPPRRKSA